ncbi:hypothetical protein [Microcella frigidaquae]|uniref:DUF1508 domain-containing protein n=1 Tax=Microcella frigidaquae TaxID=424758 RepID=A0A840XNJ6_9MICO|nr:hypothetical protein [Microcella frigidaquae]MBB5617489.1 hypothetical protein [Microcella frigidaquae]MCA1941990.1 hypothetical protein [Microcella sp.]NHN45358.1 hypothetical protein [Microcella frigidaquae]
MFVVVPAGGRQHVSWIEHSVSVVGHSVLGAPHSGNVVGWQLVTSNGRSICRSVAFQADFDGALRALDDLRVSIAELDVSATIRPSDHLYGWWARLDGRPAIVGARWYSSIRDNRAAIEVALRSLVSARLETGKAALGETGHHNEQSRSQSVPVHVDAAVDSSLPPTLGAS